ncbi:hypothetical protein E2C01_010100 [Portunus trituberculatus]|uniref:Uncharacterized protein n=1 Tax=Portunus trituberculatus TaxID=210409 RepID=A0A5B7D7J8_PORTR|nr:hypothetical protein [Portunus trituberculatus]
MISHCGGRQPILRRTARDATDYSLGGNQPERGPQIHIRHCGEAVRSDPCTTVCWIFVLPIARQGHVFQCTTVLYSGNCEKLERIGVIAYLSAPRTFARGADYPTLRLNHRVARSSVLRGKCDVIRFRLPMNRGMVTSFRFRSSGIRLADELT